MQFNINSEKQKEHKKNRFSLVPTQTPVFQATHELLQEKEKCMLIGNARQC